MSQGDLVFVVTFARSL